ncbi:hypothetical protein SLS63_000505 [Diaporthe eres]|uniref:AAA+ ATPase domain-containing protein n=1 Tax=Diaporthe eres TaxID=83184 RepID=A0ABR1PRI1_DIAER
MHQPFARDDDGDRVEGLPVQCLHLDPGDVDYFFGIYRHGDPRQTIHDLCEGKGAFKGVNERDVDRGIQHRADEQDEGSTKTKEPSPWDALGLGTEVCAASEETFWYTIFETACWSKAAVEEARSKYMEDRKGWTKDSQRDICRLPDYLALIQRRSEFLVAAGWLYARHLARQWLNSTQAGGTETAGVSHATARSLESLVDNIKRNDKASGLALIAQCLAKQPATSDADQDGPIGLRPLADDVRRATRYSILSGLPYRPELGLSYNDMLTEASALIRYNLELSVGGNPLNSPVTNESGYRYACDSNTEENEIDEEEEEEGGRATHAVILDLPLFSGSLAPRCVVEDIAAGLRADVVHITSNSIARLLECPLPLASDGTRIPTDPISKLRFRVAERSGWLNSAAKSLAKPKYANERVLNRRYLESIYTGGRITSDSEEREWEHCDNLKVDAGLDMIREMQMSSEAQSPTHQLRPILIHIHDFNALFMDESDVLKQILLWTGSLRSDGCKVSVIGTGSISRASQQHWHFLDLDFASTEGFRVISLPSSLPGIDSTALEERESLLCNAEMIAKLIVALHEPQDVDGRPLVSEYQSEIVEYFDDYPLLRRGVLPLQLVDRIATATVGNLKAHAETGPVAAEHLRQALSESLSLFAGIGDSCAVAPPPSRSEETTTRREREAPPWPTSTSENNDENTDEPSKNQNESSIEQSLLDGLIRPKDIKTTFHSIHLPQSTIKSIRLLTELALLQPEEFSYGILAAERIRGCLLYGPPGTGKTLLAKAVAKETGANVLEVTAASIQHSQVGVSEKTVRSLFSLAKRADLSPLIIFVDEADSLLGSRDGGGADSSGGWRRSVMNQFLREMDGLEASSACVMLATNRPFDLDDAVLRRLPRKLLVDMPLEADRAAILRIHLAGEELDPAVSVDDIARRTPLYSGSDLKNVCVAAAMACVYEGFGGERGSAGQTTEVSSRRRRRVLSAAHFEVALSEISASVSVDMASLRAIKRFDDKYGGDAGAKRQRKAGVGFGGNVEVTDADVPRVRM